MAVEVGEVELLVHLWDCQTSSYVGPIRTSNADLLGSSHSPAVVSRGSVFDVFGNTHDASVRLVRLETVIEHVHGIMGLEEGRFSERGVKGVSGVGNTTLLTPCPVAVLVYLAVGIEGRLCRHDRCSIPGVLVEWW